MDLFKRLHWWMFILLLITQVGIFSYYWPRLERVSWEIHFHYWLVTLWYLLIVVQPYLATHGKLVTHRSVGIFGFLLAGGVIFTGLSMLDIPLKLVAELSPDRPGPPAAFYFGTLIVECLLMLAFAFAVYKAIVHRHQRDQHAWWLVCSAFYMMAPALGRGMIVFWRNLLPAEQFTPLYPILSTELIYIGLLLVFAMHFRKLSHPATLLGFALVVVRLLRLPMGGNESLQEFLNWLIRW